MRHPLVSEQRYLEDRLSVLRIHLAEKRKELRAIKRRKKKKRSVRESLEKRMTKIRKRMEARQVAHTPIEDKKWLRSRFSGMILAGANPDIRISMD